MLILSNYNSLILNLPFPGRTLRFRKLNIRYKLHSDHFSRILGLRRWLEKVESFRKSTTPRLKEWVTILSQFSLQGLSSRVSSVCLYVHSLKPVYPWRSLISYKQERFSPGMRSQVQSTSYNDQEGIKSSLCTLGLKIDFRDIKC